MPRAALVGPADSGVHELPRELVGFADPGLPGDGGPVAPAEPPLGPSPGATSGDRP